MAGKVTQSLIDEYLFAVEDIRPDAVHQAINRFRKSQVPRDHGFPVTTQELGAEARRIALQLDAREAWEGQTFITDGSPEWLALCEARGSGLPVVDRMGEEGWYVQKSALQSHSALIAKHKTRNLALEAPGYRERMKERIAALAGSLPKGVTAGDDARGVGGDD